MFSIRNIRSNKDKKFECMSCDKDFQSKKTLNNHNEKTHKPIMLNDNTAGSVNNEEDLNRLEASKQTTEQNQVVLRMSIEEEQSIIEEMSLEIEIIDDLQKHTFDVSKEFNNYEDT